MRRKTIGCLLPYSAAVLLLAGGILLPGFASAGEAVCNQCHPDIAKGPFEHQAIGMGCTACHGALDAESVPHRMTGPAGKGLSEPQPQLCYGCHDRKMFEKKNVHAAVQAGCTSCHEPHASKNKHLLRSRQPDLCFTCHDGPEFRGKYGHGPSASGFCLACHEPHASKNEHLLKSRQPDLCFTCHDGSEFRGKYGHGPSAAGLCTLCHSPHAADVKIAILRKDPLQTCLYCHDTFAKGRHLITGIRSDGHPFGLPVQKRRKKSARDPLRKGRHFYCGSCHDPHSSDSTFMVRFPFSSPYDICTHCHGKQED